MRAQHARRLAALLWLAALAALLAAHLTGCGGNAVDAPAKAPAKADSLRGKGGVLPPGMRPEKPAGHLATISCLSFSPDGRRLLSGSADSTLLVWDVASGEVVQRLEGHTGFVRGCAFLPGGRAVSGGARGEVFVWDVATAKILRELGTLGPKDSVYSLSATASGAGVMVGTNQGQALGFETETGKETFSWKHEDFGTARAPTIWTVGISPDGSRFAGGETYETYGWDSDSPTVSDHIEFTSSAGVAFPKSSRLLGGASGKLRYFIGRLSFSSISAGLTERVAAIAADPTGNQALVTDLGGRARVIRIMLSEIHCTLDSDSPAWAAAWSPTGDHVAVAGAGQVRVGAIRDCAGGEPLPVRTFGAARSRVQSVAFGTSLLLGDGSGRVSTWDRKTWGLTASVQAHKAEVLSIAPLPDGRWVSGGEGDKIVLGGQGAPRDIADLQAAVFSLAALPGGEAVLAGDGKGRVLEVALPPRDTALEKAASAGSAAPEAAPPPKSTPVERWRAPGRMYRLAVEPGGAAVIAGGGFTTIARVPLNTDTPPSKWPLQFATDLAATSALALLPDGRVVHGSTRGDVLVRRGEAVLQRLSGLSSQVVGFGVAGDHLWGGDTNGTLVRWKIGGPETPDLVLEEGVGVGDLRASDDVFVTGLDSGGASVRSLEAGALVASLYPFRDGSGATVFADGSYDATPGLARALRLEDPSTRRVVTLGEPLPLRITTPQLTPLSDGSTAVRVTVLSPGGPPAVTLEGGLAAESVIPSPTILSAYEASFRVAAPRGEERTLTAKSPSGDTLSATVDIPPVPPFSPDKTRALLIANSAYQNLDKLPWAVTDAARARAFFEGVAGLHLPADRIESHTDLRGNGPPGETLSGKVKAFFARAEAGETLFFYYAGHATTGDRVCLTPIDTAATTRWFAPDPPTKDLLPIPALWEAIRASPAARVVLIVEIVSQPWTVHDRELGMPEKAVLLHGNGANLWSTTDTHHFTTVFFDALSRPEAIEPGGSAVTVGSAFRWFLQNPHTVWDLPVMLGRGDVSRLPLSFPRKAP